MSDGLDAKSAMAQNIRDEVNKVLTAAGIEEGINSTKTKAGWCLREGLCHVAAFDNQSLLPRISHHGVPTFYLKHRAGHCRHEATQDLKDPQTCFQSLCRIIAGQFVSGKSAQAAWKRLLALSKDDSLTPESILQHKSDVEAFQKQAGLTKAKTRSILDLADHFADGRLSEQMLEKSSEDAVRKALLQVKGIGEWSCDMFLLFYLERSNVLPLGDLGVRKGIAKHFSIKNGAGPNKTLCPRKDGARIQERVQGCVPFLSLFSYYMWRVADTPLAPPDASSSSDSDAAAGKEEGDEEEGKVAQDRNTTAEESALVAKDAKPAPEEKTSELETPLDLTPPPRKSRRIAAMMTHARAEATQDAATPPTKATRKRGARTVTP